MGGDIIAGIQQQTYVVEQSGILRQLQQDRFLLRKAGKQLQGFFSHKLCQPPAEFPADYTVNVQVPVAQRDQRVKQFTEAHTAGNFDETLHQLFHLTVQIIAVGVADGIFHIAYGLAQQTGQLRTVFLPNGGTIGVQGIHEESDDGCAAE